MMGILTDKPELARLDDGGGGGGGPGWWWSTGPGESIVDLMRMHYLLSSVDVSETSRKHPWTSLLKYLGR